MAQSEGSRDAGFLTMDHCQGDGEITCCQDITRSSMRETRPDFRHVFVLLPPGRGDIFFVLYVLHVQPSLRYLAVFMPFCLKPSDHGEKNFKNLEALNFGPGACYSRVSSGLQLAVLPPCLRERLFSVKTTYCHSLSKYGMVKKGRGRGELGDMRRWDWEDGGICVGYGSSILQATIRSINALSINFCQSTDIVIWQASPGQITGDSGTCSRERPISFPLINMTSSQTQAPTVFPQTSKGPANMDWHHGTPQT
ncbi:hypothetical protein ARMGADRAFT_1062842 [Armillaria gallica]|uniref:Uncharacterized protein n=1 Tax=Armillaria gallica TaxID=47427 RepID=A0A2H3DYF3_ARMGA|nr:hypothetical protein ARMGADRAFT_1062842 [Armillaria gallica]